MIVDDPVPADVTGGPFIGPVGQASSVLSPLLAGPPGSRPRFIAQPDGTYDHLLEFDGFGRLVPSSYLRRGKPAGARRRRLLAGEGRQCRRAAELGGKPA